MVPDPVDEHVNTRIGMLTAEMTASATLLHHVLGILRARDLRPGPPPEGPDAENTQENGTHCPHHHESVD